MTNQPPWPTPGQPQPQPPTQPSYQPPPQQWAPRPAGPAPMPLAGAPASGGASRSGKPWKHIIGYGLTALVCIGIGASTSKGAAEDTALRSTATPATHTVTRTVTEKAAPPTTQAEKPKPKASTTIPGDGTFLVGRDIKPGLYRTSGGSCYWERERDLKGGVHSIIANDNTSGPTTVQIRSTDKAFKTSGCDTWHKR